MGIASSFFYSSNETDKQTLHRRIRPTEEQFEEQQERWNSLADHLSTELEEQSKYAIRTWLQGSYKFGTQVRPAYIGEEYDIDLGVYFQWKGEPEDGRYKAEDLKSMTQESLKSYKGDDVIEVVSPAKPRCSRIRFKGDFHIDVPAYHLDPDRDVRALATEQNGWEHSDPKELFLWFKNKFTDYVRDKVRRHIRYVKCWAALKFRDEAKRPSSTLLTVLVAEAIDGIPDDEMAADDNGLLAVLEKIVERLEKNRDVPNPVDQDEILTHRLSPEEQDAFVDSLRTFRDVAKDALASNNILAAADKWASAFEHFFPMPDAEEISKFAEARTQLPVPLTIPEVAVRAVARNNPNLKWTGTNKIGPISKDCDIYFKVINPAKLPGSAFIEWMVRNEGNEAEYTNDLGHKAGIGLSAQERSAYKGTHYMDCIVKQFSQIVGIRRIRVEISGMFTPRRNPDKRRPYYARLRGRH